MNVNPTPAIETIREGELSDPNDYNKETTRVYRAQKQIEFYGITEEGHSDKLTIADLYGKPLTDRFYITRSALFSEKIPQTKEEAQQNMIQRTFESIDNFYPRIAVAKEILMPGYLAMIDTSYKTIQIIEDTNERASAFLRLASVVYTLGIMIHPAADGNGQTFRTLALSYIQEGCPRYMERYFPLKISQNFNLRELGFNTPFVDNLIQLPIEEFQARTSKDQELLDLLNQVNKIRKEAYESPEDYETWRLSEFLRNRRIYILLKEKSETLGIDMTELERSLESLDQNPTFETKEQEGQLAPRSAANLALRAIVSRFMILGYDEDSIVELIYRSNRKIARSTSAQKTLLGDPICITSLCEYIISGVNSSTALAENNPRSQLIFNLAIDTFKAVAQNMIELLDNSEISNRNAIMLQMQLGRRYFGIARKLENLAFTDFQSYWRIMDQINRNWTRNMSLQELIQMLGTLVDEL